jgi:hypothetical protein
MLMTNPPTTAATVVSEELQVADWVRSFVVPSLYLPVAESCVVDGTVNDELAPVT